MKKKFVLGTVLAILSIAMIHETVCGSINEQQDRQLHIPQTFRLLAIEGFWCGTQSGQFLIRKLTQYSNWNNQTSKAYIHLLSNHIREECIDAAKDCWVGNSTKMNMRSEILDFLGQTGPEDFTVLYFNGHGGEQILALDDIINSSELLSWLSVVKGTVCVILDSCYSGSWVDDGNGGILGPGRIVLTSSRSDEVSWGGSVPYYGAYFTGYERVYCPPSRKFIPVGLIGVSAESDSDNDGWLSVLECFDFANSSLVQSFHNENPLYFNNLTFDSPLLLLPPQQARFYVSSTPWANEALSFIASDGTMVNYTWDFGDGNITSVSQSEINHTYNNPGNYLVTLNVTDNQGLSNASMSWITVTILGDIDCNFKVNLPDLVFLAFAYGSKPSNTNWNPYADIDSNGIVGLNDLVILAQNYGQQYP